MRFEAREVKSEADFVRVADLTIGVAYWDVTFRDSTMTIPEITALVFVGRDLHPDEPGLYFQDAESHASGQRFEHGRRDPAHCPTPKETSVTAQGD